MIEGARLEDYRGQNNVSQRSFSNFDFQLWLFEFCEKRSYNDEAFPLIKERLLWSKGIFKQN